MHRMIDLEDDIFQALCQIEHLRDYIEEGGTIARVEDDLVEINLPRDSYTEINLRPVKHLIRALEQMK